MKYLLSLAALGLSAPLTLAGDLYVPGSHSTIQAAIAAATPGDTVHVGAGTWVEAINYLGKDITVTATSGASVTTLVAPLNSGSVVTFTAGESPAALLEGFHVTDNGNLDFAPLIRVVGASPTLHECDIEGMEAAGLDISQGSPLLIRCEIHDDLSATGRGLVLSDSDAELEFSSIHDLDQAAVLTNRRSRPTLTHTTIHDCAWGVLAGSDVPFGQAELSHVTIEHGVLARNFQDSANGAAMLIGPGLSGTIRDSLLFDHASGCIATIGNQRPADQLVVERCSIQESSTTLFRIVAQDVESVVITDNLIGLIPDAQQKGGGFFVHNFGTAQLQYNTVSGFQVGSDVDSSGALVYEQCLFGFQPPGPAFLGQGPELSGVTNSQGAGVTSTTILDPGFVDRFARDLHLAPGSVAIDQGSTPTAQLDVDAEPRPSPTDWGGDEAHNPSMWSSGSPLSGGTLRLVFRGDPADSVLLGVSSSLLPAPIPTAYGDLELGGTPLLFGMGSIGANGLLEVPIVIPSYATPYALHLQSLVGLQLTSQLELLVGG